MTFRKGAIGALLDEYEKAMLELQKVIENISDQDLATVVDTQTKDLDCKSIQTILTHVVNSGYGYAVSIHNHKGHDVKRPNKVLHPTAHAYIKDLAAVFAFTENVFKNIKDGEIEQYDNARKIKVSWEQFYDIEQLMEHAIVHILRHRRQIEKFKIILNEIRIN